LIFLGLSLAQLSEFSNQNAQNSEEHTGSNQSFDTRLVFFAVLCSRFSCLSDIFCSASLFCEASNLTPEQVFWHLSEVLPLYDCLEKPPSGEAAGAGDTRSR